MMPFAGCKFFFTILAVESTQSIVLSFPPLSAIKSGTNNSKVEPSDSRYERWTNPGKVSYVLDDSYSEAEKTMIRGAMLTISMNTNQCINFDGYDPGRPAMDYLYISKHFNDGSIPPTCVTFFGRVTRAAGRGQKMVIRDGPDGCMDSVRSLMRVLVNVLGLRNEYRRPDRQQYMEMYNENLKTDLTSALIDPYNDSEVYYGPFPFDYFSVTMMRQTQYAAPNTTIYRLPDMLSIPYLDQLSLDDCLGLALLYGCNASACSDPYAGVGLGFSSSNRSISDTVQNIGLVLLAPSRPSANSTTNGSSPATLFRVVALNNSMQQDIFGQGHLPPNVTMNDSANSHVNVTLFYSGKPNDGQSFILDKNTSIASLQPKQGGTVTLNLKNTSNSTAYIGIYGPSGFTGGLVTALNNSGVVYNSNTTTWAPASTDTPAWNSSTLASTADTTTGPRSLFP